MIKRNKWSFENKLAILKEAEQLGATATVRKHGLNYATYRNWKTKYEMGGEPALAASYQRVNPEIKKLRIEVHQLKELVAEKELMIKINSELLKKISFRNKIG